MPSCAKENLVGSEKSQVTTKGYTSRDMQRLPSRKIQIGSREGTFLDLIEMSRNHSHVWSGNNIKVSQLRKGALVGRIGQIEAPSSGAPSPMRLIRHSLFVSREMSEDVPTLKNVWLLCQLGEKNKTAEIPPLEPAWEHAISRGDGGK